MGARASVATAASSYPRLNDEVLDLCPNDALWVDAEAFDVATATARRSRDLAVYRAAVELYTPESSCRTNALRIGRRSEGKR